MAKDELSVEKNKIEPDLDDAASTKDKEEGPVVEKNKGKTDKTVKSTHVALRIPKKVLLIIMISMVVVILSLLTWQQKWYKPVWDYFNKANVTVRVKEEDKFAVQDAKVELNGQTYMTNSDGTARIEKVVAGTYMLKVSKEGYQEVEKSIKLKRGDNDLVLISITKMAEKLYTVKGILVDYVNSKPLADTQVTLKSTTVATSDTGEFVFDQLPAGEYSLNIAKTNYIEKNQTVSVADKDVDMDKVALVPKGTAVYVSNRDGKKSLYAANYDGSNERQLVENKSDADLFDPVISPDGKWVVYASTQDKIKNNYGSSLAKLYIVGIDGQNNRKVADEVGYVFNVDWSQDSANFFYTGYADSRMEQSVYKIYQLSKSQTLDVGENVSYPTFAIDSSNFIYASSLTEQKPTYSTYYPPVTPSTSGTVSPSPTQIVSGSVTVNYGLVKSFNLSSGERKELVKMEGYLSDLRLNEDGSQIAYSISNNGKKRYTVSINGGESVEVALPADETRSFVKAPKTASAAYLGWQAFVEDRDGKRDIFVIDKNEKNEKRLTTIGTVNQSTLFWDGTGKYIIFTSRKEAESALYIVSFDGGEPKKIADIYDAGQY